MHHAPIRRHRMSTRVRKNKRVSREEKRLRKLFGRILIASIVAPVAAAGACSSSSNDRASNESPDATTSNEAGSISEAGGPITDAATICAPTSIYVDAALPDGAIDCDI